LAEKRVDLKNRSYNIENLDISTTKKNKSSYCRIQIQNDHYKQYKYIESENMIIDMHDDLIELHIVFCRFMLSMTDNKKQRTNIDIYLCRKRKTYLPLWEFCSSIRGRSRRAWKCSRRVRLFPFFIFR
jgi:hypothetical protein